MDLTFQGADFPRTSSTLQVHSKCMLKYNESAHNNDNTVGNPGGGVQTPLSPLFTNNYLLT